MNKQKQLSLSKHDETFIFRYQIGSENELLDTIVATANDRGNSFDWFDAAVLSFQLSKHLVEEADRLLCSNADVSVEFGACDDEDLWIAS